MSLLIKPIALARRFFHGYDSEKPPDPQPGDLFLAIDSGQLYLCFSRGEWAKYGGITGFNPGYAVTRLEVARKEVTVQ